MFGIEITEIALFLKQLGFAVAGAAALWGAVLSRKDDKCGSEDCILYDFLSLRLLKLFSGATLLGTVAYLVLLSLFSVYAHEGIAISPTASETVQGLLSMGPILFLSIALTILALILRKTSEFQIAKYLTPFFLIQFILFFILTSIPAITGAFDARQAFFIGHGFHSIFTLGSVITLDFLFLTSKRSAQLVQHVVPMFPTISKVIWAGFGFDLLSALFILPLAEITTKVIFMQTVVGILLINGVILSGTLTRRITSATMGGAPLSRRWERIADICGTISISSWTTITLVDSFERLTLSYPALFVSYLVLVAVLWSGHTLLGKYEKSREAPVFIH